MPFVPSGTPRPALARWRCPALVLALLCATALHSPASARSGADLVLLAGGDLRGEIKPCGCSPEGQMGGLPRRLTYLREQAAAGPVLTVDLGNNFPEPSPQGRIKVDLIQTLLRRAGLAAILPGPNEIALGLSFLDPELPYVVSNGQAPAPLAFRRVAQRNGRRIGLLGYLSPALVYQGPQTRLNLLPASPALVERWRAEARADGWDAMLLLFRGDERELAVFAQSGAFRVIVSGNPSADELHQIVERRAGGATIPQVPTKGQGLLRWTLPMDGKPPAPPAVDWLTDKLADHPAATAALEAYDARVKALFFEQAALAESQRQESPFVGAEACQGCHPAAAAAWRQARHSHALGTLERVGKAFDPECLACHVAGLGRGGFSSAEATPQLGGVQCENCHGPGRAHAAAPTAQRLTAPAGAGPTGRPTENTCRSCHMGSHSPKFAFADYWPRIQHR
jgi:hypothetical protein